MSEIILENLYLSYPVYGADTRSLKRSLFCIATGGVVAKNSRGPLIIEALSNISLHLKKGDKLGLIGHNGAGKSTLLKVMAGLYEPQQGNIRISGTTSTLLNISAGFNDYSTGYENIKMFCLLRGYNKKKQQKITEDVVAFSELGDYLAMPLKAYSTGMRVRLAFALSTTVVPDILLIDEVMGAGDANFMRKAQNRINKLISNSNILVLASHSNEIIKEFCNKVLWLDHGKIKAFGTTEEVIQEYETNPV